MCCPALTRSPATDVDAALPHVRVRGRDGLAVDGVLDDDEAAVPAGELRDGDGAVRGGEDRRAVGRGEVGAGVQLPFARDRVHAHPERRGQHPGALGQREHHPRRRDRRATHANAAVPAAAGEGGEDAVGDGRVVAVAVGVGGHLDGLGGFAGVHLLPAGDVEQAARRGVVRSGRPAEERSRLIVRVHQLCDGAPPGLRAHLEQAEGVVVAAVAVVRVVRRLGVGAGVGEHPQRGLGERGHQRDLDSRPAHVGDAVADGDDRCRVRELLTIQGEGLAVRGGHGERVRDRAEVHGPGGGGAVGGSGVHQHPDAEECCGGGEEQQRQGCDGGFAEHDANPFSAAGCRAATAAADGRSDRSVRRRRTR